MNIITQPTAVTHAAEQNIKSQTNAPAQLRFESIDGLRGLACLLVVAYHSTGFFPAQGWPSIHLASLHISLYRMWDYGRIGVDIFFVLSGFCLAYPIVSKPDRTVNWGRYFVHRVRRIIPPYWAAMLLFAGLGFVVRHFQIRDLVSAGFLAWPPMHQLVASLALVSYSFNLSFWTLPVEWRWYFVLPALLLIWRYAKGPGLLVCTLLCSLASYPIFLPYHSEKLRYLVTFLPIYLPYFALGIWAAELVAKPSKAVWEAWLLRHAYLGIMVALALALTFNPFDSIMGRYWMMVGRVWSWGPLCFFLVLTATQDGGIRKVFSWKPLVSVGIFSYSLYLTHQPFIIAAALLMKPLHWPPALLFLFSFFVLGPVLIGFGYLFFLVAEKPFLRRSVMKAIVQEKTVVSS